MARQDQVIAFRHVRIFDGVRILPYDTLVIQGDTIIAIGDETVIPPEAEIIIGVLFTAGPTPGLFAFQIDDVRFL